MVFWIRLIKLCNTPDLLLSLQTFLLVEILASKLVTHLSKKVVVLTNMCTNTNPLNNIQSLLIECLWFHRLPTCSSAFTLPACHLLKIMIMMVLVMHLIQDNPKFQLQT